MTGPCDPRGGWLIRDSPLDKFTHFPFPICYHTTMPTFIARVNRTEPVEGIKTITLTLIRDDEYVELEEGDEFLSVILQVDPFAND